MAAARFDTVNRFTIARLGARGEGVAEVDGRRIFVPFTLPGETVTAEVEGERGTLAGILAPSAERIPPICPYFTTCGGCAVQAWADAPYRTWKCGLVVEALSRASVEVEVASLLDAHGAGRRRATFHARTDRDGATQKSTTTVGFMRARAHEIIAIEDCPILDPRLAGALPAARAIAAAIASAGKPLDIVALATDSGLDIDLRGHGTLSEGAQKRLVAVALAHRLARLSNHGVIVVERVKPELVIGRTRVQPPPGTFQQATAAGEAALAQRVVAALSDAKRVADLFAGIGTFALRLAETAEVTAVDTQAPALVALDRAARATSDLNKVEVETRDLFSRPLGAEELSRFDGIVLDPPRAGAEAQIRAIAASKIERVASVACDAQTFARDTAILLAAGFTTEKVEPIDQFRYSPHVEIFAAFRRAPAKKKRRLLG